MLSYLFFRKYFEAAITQNEEKFLFCSRSLNGRRWIGREQMLNSLLHTAQLLREKGKEKNIPNFRLNKRKFIYFLLFDEKKLSFPSLDAFIWYAWGRMNIVYRASLQHVTKKKTTENSEQRILFRYFSLQQKCCWIDVEHEMKAKRKKMEKL